MSRRSIARGAVLCAALVLAGLLAVPAPLWAQPARVTVEVWRGTPAWARAVFEDAVAAAVPVMETRLGLRVADVRYVVFADRRALVEGYRSLLSVPNERAEPLVWSTGRAIRHTSGNYVFTRLDGFGRFAPSRLTAVRHVAHELTHIAQGAVKGCPPAVPSWVTEGWADWAALRTVDALGLRSYEWQREDLVERVRRARDHAFFPALVQLDRLEWARFVQSRGREATYGSAFLAVERLVTRAGTSALDAYCLAARRSGRWVAFERTFGVSEPDFALEHLGFLNELSGPVP